MLRTRWKLGRHCTKGMKWQYKKRNILNRCYPRFQEPVIKLQNLSMAILDMFTLSNQFWVAQYLFLFNESKARGFSLTSRGFVVFFRWISLKLIHYWQLTLDNRLSLHIIYSRSCLQALWLSVWMSIEDFPFGLVRCLWQGQCCASFEMGTAMSSIQRLFSNKITPLIIQPLSPPPISSSPTSVAAAQDDYNNEELHLRETAIIGLGTIHYSSMERQYATSEIHLDP